MNEFIEFLETSSLGQGLTLVFGWVVLLSFILIARCLVWQRLKVMAHHTKSKWDDHALKDFSTPSVVLCVLLSLFIVLQFAPDPIRYSQPILIAIRLSTLITSAWGAYRFLNSLLAVSSSPFILTDTTRTLLLTVLRVVALATMILLVLDNLGISITPILASLGVGSVAVALALQDTLSNFFSGFYILVDKPVEIGDFVQTESGIEGYVIKVGWRSTHIRMLSNNIAVIPNSKLASQRLTNFDMLGKETAVSVAVGVGYESDLDEVERVTCEVAREVLSTVEGGVSSFTPSVRFNAFNSSSIDFNVSLRAKQITDQYILKHEFMKALHKRYAKEGITLPYPQRVVQIMQTEKPSARIGNSEQISDHSLQNPAQ